MEALSGVARENDEQYFMVKAQELIAEELQNPSTAINTEQGKLAQLPPHLENIEKIANTITGKANRLSSNFNEIPIPDNEQNWEPYIRALQLQLAKQEDAILNAELLQEHLTSLSTGQNALLQHNAILEKTCSFYSNQIKTMSKQIHEVQKNRREVTEKLKPQLLKYQRAKHNSIIRRLSCNQTIEQLKWFLKSRGFDYEEYCKEQELMKEKLDNPFDVRFNSTIQQYETINETTTTTTVEDEEIEGTTKDGNSKEIETSSPANKKLRIE